MSLTFLAFTWLVNSVYEIVSTDPLSTNDDTTKKPAYTTSSVTTKRHQLIFGRPPGVPGSPSERQGGLPLPLSFSGACGGPERSTASLPHIAAHMIF